MAELDLPKDGILWRDYGATLALLQERTRPVLLVVLDSDGARFPFLRELLAEMPKSEKLRTLLAGPCAAMLLKADALPNDMRALGAGSRYHVAILSPSGLTPMATFDFVSGRPRELVAELAKALEALAGLWA